MNAAPTPYPRGWAGAGAAGRCGAPRRSLWRMAAQEFCCVTMERR